MGEGFDSCERSELEAKGEGLGLRERQRTPHPFSLRVSGAKRPCDAKLESPLPMGEED